MNWGTGPALGLLTVSGYLLFMAGVALVWRSRSDFSVWFQDELSVFRRNFSRYTPAGPFYAIREESRFKAIPVSFVRSITRFPRSRINGGPILLFIGFLLLILDFFV
ncbi:MAG TPA: hypothetical protein VGR03_11900 [Candidatus Acidoferrum sp.]|nr:hypothetical protein [Candidatus Acidoferrum sp.]